MWNRICRLISFAALSLLACGIVRMAIPVDRSLLHAVKNAEGEMGYVDSRGQAAIPFGTWDHAGDFWGDFAIVGNGGSGGDFRCIDRNGEDVPALNRKGWQIFAPNLADGQIRVWDKEGTNKVGIVDREGNVVVPFEWDSIDFFDSFGMSVVTRDGKKGLIRGDGSVVIPPEWDGLSTIGDGTFLEGYKGNSYTPLYRGPEITGPAESSPVAPFRKDGYYGVQRWDGEVLIPATWRDLVLVRHEGNTYARVRDKKHYGLIDMDGQTVIPRTWRFFGLFGINSQGVTRAQKDDKYGMINLAGEEVVPFEWDALEEADQNGYVFARKGEHWGAINNEGEILIPFEWDNIMPFNNALDLAPVRKGGTWGLINREGKQVITFPWDIGPIDRRGWMDARDGAKNGMIRADGTVVIPIIWENSRVGKRGAIRELYRPAEYRNYPIFEMLDHREPSFISKVKQKWNSLFGGPTGFTQGTREAFHYELRDVSGRLIWDSDSLSYSAKSWLILGGGIFLCVANGWYFKRRRRRLV